MAADVPPWRRSRSFVFLPPSTFPLAMDQLAGPSKSCSKDEQKKKSPYACKRKKESMAETGHLIQFHFLLWRREAFWTGFILYSLPCKLDPPPLLALPGLKSYPL